MRAAIYCRISTSNKNQNLDNQIYPLRNWAKNLGYEIVFEFCDAESGTTHERKGLKQLFEVLHKGKVDVILVWSIDRLSREGIGRLCYYIEVFKKYNVQLLSHQERWLSTDGPTADLLIAVFAWVAKLETQRLRERVKSGLARARREGKKLGRPTCHFNIEKARELHKKGFSLRNIARDVGVSKSTLHKYLSEIPS